MVLVGPGPDEARRAAIGTRPLAHQAANLHLIQLVRYARERLHTQGRGDFVEEVFDTGDTDDREHGLDVGRSVRNEGHQSPSSC